MLLLITFVSHKNAMAIKPGNPTFRFGREVLRNVHFELNTPIKLIRVINM
jgi:hypothetical protein